MDRRAGLLLIGIGIAVTILGLVVASGALNWFGRLPGDIRIERDHVRVYVPITSMLVASLALSAVAALLRRLF